MVDRQIGRAHGAKGTVGVGGSIPPADPLGTALWLHDIGLWPLAVTPAGDPRWPGCGKSPIGKGWGNERPSPPGLRRIFRRHPRAGVALLLGPAGGVIDLESDDPVAAEGELRRLFPGGLPDTLGWASARGEHRLFSWDDRVADLARTAVVPLRGGAFELRLGGGGKRLASVCPPSLTTEGVPRSWNGCWKIAPAPVELLDALHEVASRREESSRKAASRPQGCSALPGTRWERYGAAALAREAEAVRSAQPGGRNRTLNRAAFCLGQLVAGGAIGRLAVEGALLGAALDCGLGQKEAEATIRSGLDAGCERPRAPRG